MLYHPTTDQENTNQQLDCLLSSRNQMTEDDIQGWLLMGGIDVRGIWNRINDLPKSVYVETCLKLCVQFENCLNASQTQVAPTRIAAYTRIAEPQRRTLGM